VVVRGSRVVRLGVPRFYIGVWRQLESRGSAALEGDAAVEGEDDHGLVVCSGELAVLGREADLEVADNLGDDNRELKVGKPRGCQQCSKR
jgi:hypothetical protein